MAVSALKDKNIVILQSSRIQNNEVGIVKILEGINKGNEDLGANLLFLKFYDKGDKGFLENLSDLKADLVITFETLPEGMIDGLSRKNIRIIGLRCNSEDPRVNSVCDDAEEGGRIATRFFLERGCKKAVMFLGPLIDENQNRRSAFYTKKGCAETLSENGSDDVKIFFDHGDWDRDISKKLNEFLAKDVNGFFSASLYFSDKMAEVFYKKRLAIPDDIKMLSTGFNESIYP